MKPSKFVKDITSLKSGILTVVKFSHCENHRSYWICKCECGKEVIKKAKWLARGDVKSCGCLNKNKWAKNCKNMHLKSSSAKRIEGLWDGDKKHKLYSVWKSMKARCYRKNCREYRWYGERGIKVCEEWLNNAVAFIQWGKENGYKKGLQIDRIDNDGNYSPENCRFISRIENIRRSHENLRKNNLERNLMKKKIKIAKGKSIPKEKYKKLKKEKGMSNLGKYPDVKPEDFAGPDGTYPINTKERAKSALKLAHNATNPDAIKRAVYKKYPDLKPKKKK